MGAAGVRDAAVVYTTLPVVVEITVARSMGSDTKADRRPFDDRPLILRQTGSPCGCSVFQPDRAWSETVIHAELDLADVGPIGQESGAVAGKRRVPAEGEVVVFGLR